MSLVQVGLMKGLIHSIGTVGEFHKMIGKLMEVILLRLHNLWINCFYLCKSFIHSGDMLCLGISDSKCISSMSKEDSLKYG